MHTTDIHSMVELGLFLRTRRKELGLKQTDIAFAVGLGAPTYSRIENGHVDCTPKLFDILTVLGVQLTVTPVEAQLNLKLG